MKAVTAQTMRFLDARTISEGIHSGMELMVAAANSVVTVLRREMPYFFCGNRIGILTGKGNNGGDGFVMASILESMGYGEDNGIRLFCSCDPATLTGDARTAWENLSPELKNSVDYDCSVEKLQQCMVLIDAMLGTGITGCPRSPVREWIGMVNESGVPVLSVDIPSGLCADDGSVVDGCCVRADMTVTFALPKAGLLLGDGPRYSGRLVVTDIGIPRQWLDEAPGVLEVTGSRDIAPLFGRESYDTYKQKRGHVLVLGGSRLYSGAPLLSACGALKTGAGLVSLAIPSEMAYMGMSIPKALMVRQVPGGFLTDFASVADLAEKASAIVAGPGMGNVSEVDAFLADLLTKTSCPLLLDADALNRLSENRDLLGKLAARKGVTVLTPHSGEMMRLLGKDVIAGMPREEQAKSLALQTGSYVVLKGPHSIVADPSGGISYNLSGCTALATAGSGDVLSGITGALLGRPGADILQSVRGGVLIHGLTGEYAAPLPSSGRGVTADDLLEQIVPVLRDISPFA